MTRYKGPWGHNLSSGEAGRRAVDNVTGFDVLDKYKNVYKYADGGYTDDPEPPTASSDATYVNTESIPRLNNEYEQFLKTNDPAERQALANILHGSGNPRVNIDPPNTRGSYNAFANEMNADDQRTVIEEAAHALQFNDNNPLEFGMNVVSTVGSVLRDEITAPVENMILEDSVLGGRSLRNARYSREGTIEHEAHKEISPRLHDIINYPLARSALYNMQSPANNINDFLSEMGDDNYAMFDRAVDTIRELNRLGKLKEDSSGFAQLTGALRKNEDGSFVSTPPINTMEKEEYAQLLSDTIRNLVSEEALEEDPYQAAYNSREEYSKGGYTNSYKSIIEKYAK